MTLDELRDLIGTRLNDIKCDLLGTNYKLTLIARCVSDDVQTFLVTADDEAAIGEVLARLSPRALAAIRQYILKEEGVG